MLDHLKRFFNSSEKEPEMAQEETQAAVLAVDQSAELQLALASQVEAFAELQNSHKELTAKFEQAQAALAVIEAEKASLVAQAAATKLEARKASVVAAIGTEKAAAMLEATSSLGDEQFEAVVGALTTSLEVEAQSMMFKEVGVSGEVDASKIDDANKPTHFNQFINKK